MLTISRSRSKNVERFLNATYFLPAIVMTSCLHRAYLPAFSTHTIRSGQQASLSFGSQDMKGSEASNECQIWPCLGCLKHESGESFV